MPSFLAMQYFNMYLNKIVVKRNAQIFLYFFKKENTYRENRKKKATCMVGSIDSIATKKKRDSLDHSFILFYFIKKITI
jgi:hypothetical protein